MKSKLKFFLRYLAVFAACFVIYTYLSFSAVRSSLRAVTPF